MVHLTHDPIDHHSLTEMVRRSHCGAIVTFLGTVRDITGDEVTIDWDTPCPCGRTSLALEHSIMRFSEKKDGEEDKISCAATHEVHNQAIDFLREFQP